MSRSSSDTLPRVGRPAPRGANGRPAVGPLDALVHRLATVQSADARVVSCYLKLEPRDRARQKYAVKLKNRVKDAIAGLTRLGLDHPTREAVTRDLHRVQDAVRDPAQLPGSHGIAIFACEALDLFETVPLPFVYRSRLLVDRTPLVRELASVEDEFGRYLAVVLDRTGARFFEITAFDAREPIGIRADNTRGSRFRSVDGDISEWHYNNRIRQEKQRHYEAVARALFNFDRRQPAHGIVIAAPGPEAGAVRPFLHSYLADRLLGTAKLSPRDATPALVHEAVLAVREQHERATERALTDQMREAVGTGWAFNGTRETLRALAYGQVRTLLVHPDAAVPGFRCGDSGRLALHQRDCRGEGEPIPVLDVIDDAIEEALRQRVDVNVVYDADAAAQIDGLAALLRFR